MSERPTWLCRQDAVPQQREEIARQREGSCVLRDERGRWLDEHSRQRDEQQLQAASHAHG